MFYDCTPKNGDSMDKYAYGISMADGQLELRLAVPENETKTKDDGKIISWLTETFFPKFFNWAINDKGSKPTISSLSHICVKKYCDLYSRLKEKYAKSLMDVS